MKKHNKKELVLYAPTFSPSLTSLPKFKDGLVDFVKKQDVLLILKFHPLTKQEWNDEYKALAEANDNIIWIEDYTVTKYMLMADAMISDTSSTIYEFLLLDKPVITLDAVAKDIYWKNITDPMQLSKAYDEIKTDGKLTELRKWIIKNYDPYNDGNVAKRMLEGAKDYIRRHGVPEKRKLNLWRKYTSIKTFGKIKK